MSAEDLLPWAVADIELTSRRPKWVLDGMSAQAHIFRYPQEAFLCGLPLRVLTTSPRTAFAHYRDVTTTKPLPDGQERCPACLEALVAPMIVQVEGKSLWASAPFWRVDEMQAVWPPLAAVVGATRFAGVILERCRSWDLHEERWSHVGRMGRIEATQMVTELRGFGWTFRLVWPPRA